MAQQLAVRGGTPVRAKPFPSWPVFGKPEEERLLKAVRSGKWWKLAGTEVSEFERRFAAYQGAKHGIGVVNGTVSLRISLLAHGIDAGDEVIVPPYTFMATASAVLEANGTPVFVDIDPETFNMDAKAAEAAVTPRTRAIIPVHVGGLPVEMDAIMAIAERHGLAVIEDAAHAHGAEYKGRRVGSIGDFGSFSFQASKNLCAGEGGIITTCDDTLAERCWSIHNCGRVPGGVWYEHNVMGGNYRLGEFQGAILNAQLDRLDEQVQSRERNGTYLASQLAEVPGVTPQKRTADCTRHGYHLFLFRMDPEVFGVPRDTVIEAIRAEGIPICNGYPLPLYKQKLFLEQEYGPYAPQARDVDYSKVHCPKCEMICYEQGGWMEQSMLLGTQADMDDIVRAFTKVYELRGALRG